MIQLKTRWADGITAENVHREYPRPGLVRNSYLNLNGKWEYCINQSTDVTQYDGEILVPFSPESLLSGVMRIVKPENYLHYRKIFTLPKGFRKERVLLHFGAVDQECTIYLNGNRVGSHSGGYTAFSFDVTNYISDGDNMLTICVKDMTEKKTHARGKQKLEKHGRLSYLFYTPQSGIWKTVWMESVPADYIYRVRITPQYDEAAVQVNVQTSQTGTKAFVKVLDAGSIITEANIKTNTEALIRLGEFIPWTPEHPHLYDLEIHYGDDKVTSYFGMRKFHVEKDHKGILRFFMNNKPYFFNGVLDQGYWPESLLTPPTDEALVHDIAKLKELGFNTIRKHVKVESDRFYYHCDRLGMIVWQDMPNGGGDYNMLFVTCLPNRFPRFGRTIRDHHYKLFKRIDAEGRNQYYNDLREMIDQLYNFPCIAAWVPFNEGWGQFDASEATKRIRAQDKGRLINEACGWFDQGGGDMYSIHNYSSGLKIKPQSNRVVALTEFGGYAYADPGHLACEKRFGYQSFPSREELTQHYRQLWEQEIYPNIQNGLSAAIYTQTSDIEEEINGIFTYDREHIKLIEDDLKEINRKLYRIWEDTVTNSQN
ncbi:MAG: glycoside hydrolase family 2 [Clostridiales bacterium]|nr:glycoside hydrolase family 2 [Clostridiales bacterium]